MRALQLDESRGNRRRRRNVVELTDRPTITINDAAFFFNMGRKQFRERFEELYSNIIGYAETNNGKRLSLIGVIETAFPDADSSVVHWMAYQYLSRADARRRSQKGRSGGENNGMVE